MVPIEPYVTVCTETELKPSLAPAVTLVKLVHQVDAACFKVIASANNLDVAVFLKLGQDRTVAADGL